MSTETLKFFEDKSTEAIINWMLSHLTEDQIRMCLDQSGIPDTSVLPEPTSSSEPGSSGVKPEDKPLAILPEKPGKKSGGASQIFLDKYRKICNGTTYLIENVSKEGVKYYQFKEVESEDLDKNPNLTVGNINWVFQVTPLSEFKTYCTEEDREILELLKEESPETFNKPPPQVRQIVTDYVNNGFPSPIPNIEIDVVDISEPVVPIPVETVVEMTDNIMKALKIQQESGPFIQQNYPLLYDNGMTRYPIFIYGSEGNNILFLSASVQDGKLILNNDMSNKALLNSRFKKILKSIGDAMSAGLYIPSPDIPNQLEKEIPEGEIKNKIDYVYKTAKKTGVNFFGTLEDDLEAMNLNTPLLVEKEESFIDVPDMTMVSDSEIEMEDISSINKRKDRKKKISEMSQEELNERMLKLFGVKFAEEHDAVKYTNALGVQNVKYVKKCNCETPSRDSSFEEIENPIFTEFQGKPSVNTGTGRFGELEEIEEIEEDLLFS